ncbi:DUF2505 domain-containing protein [Haloechinothrix sp. YIM 98757]|uniref:DUF2505 domain-containing protein n=1 Tax=Haloechinothrix aidingensis TaxID=2752311 RepID=A0A837ZWS5_9PSEU|nr:DUF2505 domain-containing protein [Haloechinothrix aidingensis]MBA0124584.1 DUF2505 domain-containing protein [Haloechinothrix aidingensis]
MGARIEHSASFGWPVELVLDRLTSEDALREQLTEIGGKDAELLAHSASGSGVSYHMRQGVPAEKVPRAVRDVLAGDLVVHREQEWGTRTAGGIVRGSARATVSGVPGEVTAVTELTARDEGSLLRVTGEATVRIPLVGGKFERMIAEHVCTLLDAEARYTAERLSAHRP